MTKDKELYHRVRYISVIIDALLKAHPEWRVQRRHMNHGVQYIIFSVGEKHSSITIDPKNDDERSIYNRFHFTEADFLYYLDPNAAISLTKFPHWSMIDLNGPSPEQPSPDYRAGLKAGVQITLVAELILATVVSWAVIVYFAYLTYPG
jgi:hypothetical protein